MITTHRVNAQDDHSNGWAAVEYVSGQDVLNITTDAGTFSLPASSGRPLRECLEKVFPPS